MQLIKSLEEKQTLKYIVQNFIYIFKTIKKNDLILCISTKMIQQYGFTTIINLAKFKHTD